MLISQMKGEINWKGALGLRAWRKPTRVVAEKDAGRGQDGWLYGRPKMDLSSSP